MPRARSRPTASTSTPLSTQPSTREEILWASLAIAGALVVFWGVLPYFFAQDDFSGLGRAAGLLPPVAFPWRWLSGQVYFEAMGALAGLDPLPYRVISLFAHAVCVGLVYRLCRRFSAAPAAALGALFFGAHPAVFTALYSISGIGEILSAAFAVGSLLVVTQPSPRAWLAVPLFAASLLSKESTILLPLVVMLLPESAPQRTPATEAPVRRAITPPMWTLFAVSAVYAAAFLARDVFGVRAALDASSAYALSFDRTLIDNLLTYLGWTVTIAMPWVRSFTDAVEPQVWAAGLGFGLFCIAGLAFPLLRRRGIGLGVAAYLFALLPVLPLGHHTYHYYLYAPLAGAAVVVASFGTLAFESLGRMVGPRITVSLFALFAMLLAVNGAMLVRKIETYPFQDPELRADATIDRARIASNAVADLRAAAFAPGTQLWFWSPVAQARQASEGKDPALESYWESNVRAALYDGLAARLFMPEVTQTRFVRAFAPASDSIRYAVYLPNGHLRIGSPAELDSMLRRSMPGAP